VSSGWTVVLLVGLATMAIKSAGPLLAGGRALPPHLTGLVGALPAALLAALVATQTFGGDHELMLDERAAGVAVAAVAIVLRAPLLVVLVAAAAATAALRALS
jgi:branched-subunit amino acid transport protein